MHRLKSLNNNGIITELETFRGVGFVDGLQLDQIREFGITRLGRQLGIKPMSVAFGVMADRLMAGGPGGAAGHGLVRPMPLDIRQRCRPIAAEKGRRGRCRPDDEGTGDLSGAVRRRRGAVQLAEVDRRMGGRRSATRASRSRPGTAGCSTSRRRPSSKTYCDEVKGICARGRRRDHRAVDASAGPARRRASGL